MLFAAQIRLLTSHPAPGEVTLPTFEAKDAHTAAQIAAMKAAKGIFGERGQPGYMTWDDDGACRAVIGAYDGYGMIRGVTAIIHIHPVV